MKVDLISTVYKGKFLKTDFSWGLSGLPNRKLFKTSKFYKVKVF